MTRLLSVAFGVVVLLAFTCGIALATDVLILDYPKNVSPGGTAAVKVSWKDFPMDKDYVLRVQVEDWDAKPPVCSFKDFALKEGSGEASFDLPIVSNSGGSNTARFVAAILSKSKNWDDCVASNGTDKVVSVNSSFKLEIADFPKTVNRGSTVKVKVVWKDVKVNPANYKLLVQLENWDSQPGFAYVSNIADFKSSGEQVVDIKIAPDAPAAKDCRFVAAFISKSAEWKDAFAVTATPKEVEVK